MRNDPITNEEFEPKNPSHFFANRNAFLKFIDDNDPMEEFHPEKREINWAPMERTDPITGVKFIAYHPAQRYAPDTVNEDAIGEETVVQESNDTNASSSAESIETVDDEVATEDTPTVNQADEDVVEDVETPAVKKTPRKPRGASTKNKTNATKANTKTKSTAKSATADTVSESVEDAPAPKKAPARGTSKQKAPAKSASDKAKTTPASRKKTTSAASQKKATTSRPSTRSKK